MEEKEKREKDDQEKTKKQKDEEALPFCTTAPSAEHARASNDDEPCDDGRSGDIV